MPQYRPKFRIDDILSPDRIPIGTLGFITICRVIPYEQPMFYEASGVLFMDGGAGIVVRETASSLAQIKKLASMAHAQVMSHE